MANTIPSHGHLACCSRTQIGDLYYDAVGNVNDGAWSISLWVMYTSEGADGIGRWWQLFYDNDDHIGGGLGVNNEAKILIYGQDNLDAVDGLPLNTWVHHVITYDPTTYEVSWYINGVDKGTSTGSSVLGGSPSKLFVGWQVQHSYADLLAIRHLTIWDGVMTEAEALAAYNLGREYLSIDDQFPSCSDGDLTFYASMLNGLDAEYSVGEASPSYDVDGNRDGADHVRVGRDRGGDPWGVDVPLGQYASNRPNNRPLWLVLARSTLNIPDNEAIDEYDSQFEYDLYSGDLRATGYYYPPFSSYIDFDTGTNPMWAYLAASIANIDAPSEDFGRVPFTIPGGYYYPHRIERGTVGAGATASSIPVDGIGTPADSSLVGCYVRIVEDTSDAYGERAYVTANTGATITIGGEFSSAPSENDSIIIEGGGVISPKINSSMRPWGAYHPLQEGSDPNWERQGMLVATSAINASGYGVMVPDGGYPVILPSVGFESQTAIGLRDASGGEWDSASSMLGSVRAHCHRIRLGAPGRLMVHSVLDELFDNFICSPEGDATECLSTRMVYSTNLQRVASDAKWTIVNDASVKSSILEGGTWREDSPRILCVDEEYDGYRALLRAEDGDGNEAYGWVIGTFDDETGTMSWEDDPDVSNPFCTTDDVEALFDGERRYGTAFIRSVYKNRGGNYVWVLVSHRGGSDNLVTYLVPGGSDDYTLPSEIQVVQSMPGFSSQMEKPIPDGTMAFGVQREEFEVHWSSRNPYDANTPMVMSARAQVHGQVPNDEDLYDAFRPLNMLKVYDLGWEGFSLPNTTIVPSDVSSTYTHYPCVVVYSRNVYGMFCDRAQVGGSDWIYQATDSSGFAWTSYKLLENSGNGFPYGLFHHVGATRTVAMAEMRTGDWSWAIASCDRGREAYISISGTETSGWFVTSALKKPSGGWEELYITSDMKDGSVTVEVIDPLSGNIAISGYEDTDCDVIVGDNHEEVTWGGNSLSELDEYNYLRLKFSVTRSDGGDDSPELYEWYCGDAQTENSITGRSTVTKTTSALITSETIAPGGFSVSSTLDCTSASSALITVSTSNEHSQRPMRLEGPIAVQIQISDDGTSGSWKNYGNEVRMTVNDDKNFELPESIQYARARVRNTDNLNIIIDIDGTVSV